MRWRDLQTLFFVLLLFGCVPRYFLSNSLILIQYITRYRYVAAQTSTTANTTTAGTTRGTSTSRVGTSTSTSTRTPLDAGNGANSTSTATKSGITVHSTPPSRTRTSTETGTRPPGRPHGPHPDRPPPPPPPTDPPRRNGGQGPVQILFEVIGGLAGVLVIFGCGRCVYKYNRTPRQDRIAAVVDRHMLERELADLEEARNREACARRRSSLVGPPPPPYQRAPDYEETVTTPRSSNQDQHRNAMSESRQTSLHASSPDITVVTNIMTTDTIISRTNS